MYNWLEVEVAKILAGSGIEYDYEKHVQASNKNGFFCLDFCIELNRRPVIVEVTCWDKVKEKAADLRKKFAFLREHYPGTKLVLVVTKERLIEYLNELQPSVYITTPTTFKNYITGAKKSRSGVG